MQNNSSSSKAMLFILVTVFLDSLGFGIMIPTLPALLKEITGESVNQTVVYGGWLSFVYALAIFVFSRILGCISDQYGRRPVIWFALVGLVFNYTIMALATNIYWLFFARFFSGVAGATFSVASACVSDISPPEKRAQNFGLIGAAFGLGFIVGPIVGGLLGHFGPREPFWGAAIFALLNLIYGISFFPETLDTAKRRLFSFYRVNPLANLFKIHRSPEFFWLFITIFIYQFVIITNPTIWSFYTIEKFGWSVKEIGISMAAVGIGLILVQGFLTRIIKRYINIQKIVYIGLSIGLIGSIGFAFANGTWVLYFWIGVYSLLFLTLPSLQSILSGRVAAYAQGELQGTISSLSGLAAIVCPPIVSLLFKHFTGAASPIYFPGAPFILASIMLGVGIITFFIGSKLIAIRERERSPGVSHEFNTG